MYNQVLKESITFDHTALLSLTFNQLLRKIIFKNNDVLIFMFKVKSLSIIFSFKGISLLKRQKPFKKSTKALNTSIK